MLFNSQFFILGFLPAVLALYYAVAGNRVARQSVLVLASLGFTAGGTYGSYPFWWG